MQYETITKSVFSLKKESAQGKKRERRKQDFLQFQSYFNESPFGVHPVKDQPDHRESCQPPYETIPGANKPEQPSNKDISNKAEVKQTGGYVHRYRVHPDHIENERPLSPALDIDNHVKQGQEQQADAARKQHKRARP